MYKNKRYILWFRNDLRLHDNEALTEAVQTGAEIYPVFVFEDKWFEEKSPFGFRRIGQLRKKFIVECVEQLSQSLQEIGLSLIIRKGNTVQEIFELAREVESKCVLCNRERTTDEVLIQESLERKLWTIGQELRYFRGKMLLYTADLPFPVTHVPDNFTNFRKEVEQFVPIREPFPSPSEDQVVRPMVRLEVGTIPGISIRSESLKGGEHEALKRLEYFKEELLQYCPNSGYSKPHLSPYLSQGCLSSKLVYYQLKNAFRGKNKDFLKLDVVQDLLLRDYMRLIGKKYGDLIFHKSGIKKNNEIAGSRSEEKIASLISARTDDEFVNAILSQLKATGFVPRFAREYFARYLIEILQLDWRIGAELFEEYLLDYDPCSNWVNWQLLAGQGPEGKKDQMAQLDYLRKKYDPNGIYFSEWSQPQNSSSV